MIYLSLILVAFTIPLLYKNKQRMTAVFLFSMEISFLLSMFAFVLYLAKDNYYYNIIYKYFGINQKIWLNLIFFPISRENIIRLINVGASIFISSCLYFSVHFTSYGSSKKYKRLAVVLGCLPLIQIILYDPFVYKSVYLFLYPDYMSVQSFQLLAEIIYFITRSLNVTCLLFSILILLYAYIKAPSVHLIKNHILFPLICHTAIISAYCFILLWAPAFLLNVSKVAMYISYKTVPLGNKILLYNIFPYFSLASFCAISFITYKYAMLQYKFKNSSLEISRDIDSATITSKVFSHYMKNELLAVMAEIENSEQEFAGQTEVITSLKRISQRCNNVYEHLDIIHKSISNSSMNLRPRSVMKVLENTLTKLDYVIQTKIKIMKTYPNLTPYALIDDYYFNQVIENLILNASDAMDHNDPNNKILKILLEVHNQWIMISIQDNGTGIRTEDIGKIFNPFFSTKPTAKNWGIGLSICHKIITAHEGKIVVESKYGIGTMFKILLPLIRIQS